MRSWTSGAVLVAASALVLSPFACATSISGGGGGSGGDAATSTTSTGHGGSGGQPADAGKDGSGGCVTAQDCASSSDACNTGACINGVCGKLAANELSACDDGINCTDNTVCMAGKCGGGTLKFCPGADNCHVGTCDAMLDTCVQSPGNDGASCTDNDACTLPGTCSGGTCIPGGMVDCSFLDGTCSQGVCDQQLGCKIMPLADGASCDDQQYCTVNDTCQQGQCKGVPNTCGPVGDVCHIGMCDEASHSCISVPGNDGMACDDGNLCTAGEKCASGTCVGGLPANNGVACDDGDGCTMGTTCAGGTCTNAMSQIMQCMDGDSCCPAGCANGTDSDCLVCHAIMGPPATAGASFNCPSGKTQFCVPPPLDPSSASQAQIACEACYGAPCFLENADCAGPGYGPNPPGQYVGGNAYFGYTAGCTGDDGRVWAISFSGTTYGYWGK